MKRLENMRRKESAYPKTGSQGDQRSWLGKDGRCGEMPAKEMRFDMGGFCAQEA